MGLVMLATLSAVLHTTIAAQTTVFVKFLSPPHGYSHNLRLNQAGKVTLAKEDRIYPGDPRHSQFLNRFQLDRTAESRYRPPPLPPPTDHYYYPRPAKPFDEYGPPRYQFQADRPSSLFLNGGPPLEPYEPTGEYINPALMSISQHRSEVTYDPLLITGPQAAQYVSYLFSRGELFFHLIPHERLVLMNQRERVENNLPPHLLASIRPGHPFFFHR